MEVFLVVQTAAGVNAYMLVSSDWERGGCGEGEKPALAGFHLAV